MAARSIPRPNSRPNRVAWMADATGPRWSNASQNETPATSEPCRVSAAQPPASIRTAAAVKSWVARIRSRRSAIARGCPSSVATTGRHTTARKTTPPITNARPQKYANRAIRNGQSSDDRLRLRRLGRRPASAEPDREDARDDVAVGRDDAPADGVVAVRKARPQRDDEGPHVAGLGVGRRRRHVVALGVRHGARDVLHLLVEVQDDLRRRDRDDRAGCRDPSCSRFACACAVAGKTTASRSATREGQALQRRLLKLTASATAARPERGRGKAAGAVVAPGAGGLLGDLDDGRLPHLRRAVGERLHADEVEHRPRRIRPTPRSGRGRGRRERRSLPAS